MLQSGAYDKEIYYLDRPHLAQKRKKHANQRQAQKSIRKWNEEDIHARNKSHNLLLYPQG